MSDDDFLPLGILDNLDEVDAQHRDRVLDEAQRKLDRLREDHGAQGGSRSTSSTTAAVDDDLTKADLSDPQKAANFRSKFDSRKEYEDAYEQLPDE